MQTGFNRPGSDTNATGRSPTTEASQLCPEEVKCRVAWHDEDSVLQGLTAMPHGNPVGKAATGLGLAYGKPKEDVAKSIAAKANVFALRLYFLWICCEDAQLSRFWLG